MSEEKSFEDAVREEAAGGLKAKHLAVPRILGMTIDIMVDEINDALKEAKPESLADDVSIEERHEKLLVTVDKMASLLSIVAACTRSQLTAAVMAAEVGIAKEELETKDDDKGDTD